MRYLVTFEVQLHDDDPGEAFRRASAHVAEWIAGMPPIMPGVLAAGGLPTAGVTGRAHSGEALDGYRLVYRLEEDA